MMSVTDIRSERIDGCLAVFAAGVNSCAYSPCGIGQNVFRGKEQGVMQ